MGNGSNAVCDWVSLRKAHTEEAREHPPLRRKPGWKLKQWRLQHEVTQTAAAKLFGCSQPVLSQYERGDRDPHGEGIVERIASRTGVRW